MPQSKLRWGLKDVCGGKVKGMCVRACVGSRWLSGPEGMPLQVCLYNRIE